MQVRVMLRSGCLKICESCGKKQPSFGRPGEVKKLRWCSGCAKDQAGAVDLKNKKCEGCGRKAASFGLPGEGSGDISGTYSVQSRCTLRRGPDLNSENLGIIEAGGQITVFESAMSAQGVQRLRCAEGWISLKKVLVKKMTDQSQISKRRWCGGCAKGQAGAVNMTSKICEGCERKGATFGLPSEGKKRRWCTGCAKGHPGAVGGTNKCEDCRLKARSWALPSDKTRRRWCGGCAKGHVGAVSCKKGREARARGAPKEKAAFRRPSRTNRSR